MSPSELTDYWQEEYGIEPRTPLFRQQFKNRWCRIYSLPEGKRYPETRREYQILLQRHNRVLASLFSQEKNLVLLTTGFSRGNRSEAVQDNALMHPEARHWRSILADEENPDGPPWHLFWRGIQWMPGVLDGVITQTAEDKSWNVIVLGADTHCLYMPYDGGADLILSDEEQCKRVKLEFIEWVSPRADGL